MHECEPEFYLKSTDMHVLVDKGEQTVVCVLPTAQLH